MIIRPFQIGDFDSVIAIHKECFAAFGFDYNKHAETYRTFFIPQRTLVACEGGEIRGFSRHTFFDDDFLIDPDAQRDLADIITLDNECKSRIEAKLLQKRDEIGKGTY